MIQNHLDNFLRGWIIGNFSPSLLKTNDFEVAIYKYSAGDVHETHVHNESNEYNVVIFGEVKFWFPKIDKIVEAKKDDIIVVEKNEPTKFKSITDSLMVVIRDKSVPKDKIVVSDLFDKEL